MNSVGGFPMAEKRITYKMLIKICVKIRLFVELA